MHTDPGASAAPVHSHGRSGKPAENHTKPVTLLRLTLSDSGGRGGSEDYAAPESHAAARPPSPRKLQLPAYPRRQPALLPDPKRTPLPFPPTPTPAQPQFPPSPQRRSGQLRRAFAARLRHGAAPPARLRLRAAPAAAAPARRGTPRPAPAPGSARRRRSGTARHPPPGSGSGQRPPPPLRHGAAPPARLRLRAAPAAAATARRGPAAAPCVRHGPRRPPSGLSPEPAGRLRSPVTGPVLRLGHCQVSSFPFTQVHQRGHKGDFFQREDRVIKSKVHDLPFSFMKRWSRLWVALTRILELQFCFLDLPGTSQSRRLELQHYTLTGIIFCCRERCEELCESRVMVLPENTSVPAGVRSTLDLVQSHSQGPIWVAKTVTEIRNKTP
ncbi:skin secretory protein xP2-like [Haliaeetus albicilla]|uniref:skin secretory protein xP2-like n=1 Tax=Haliaeetus albicilla TaxID=8969 RepID=UPI0037E7A269